MQQTGLSIVQIDIGHADLGKSQPSGPRLQFRHQRLQVDRLCCSVLIERFSTRLMHPPILETRSLLWPDEAACERWAQQLATRTSVRQAFIELHGTLGAGKTTLTRHLLRALGVSGRIKSPSYAVVEPHAAPDLQAWHFDFYRFNDPHEWEDAGLRDIFAGPGLKLVEWPEQAGGLLPVPDLAVHLEPLPQADTQRRVRLDAYTPRGQDLIA